MKQRKKLSRLKPYGTTGITIISLKKNKPKFRHIGLMKWKFVIGLPKK